MPKQNKQIKLENDTCGEIQSLVLTTDFSRATRKILETTASAEGESLIVSPDHGRGQRRNPVSLPNHKQDHTDTVRNR